MSPERDTTELLCRPVFIANLLTYAAIRSQEQKQTGDKWRLDLCIFPEDARGLYQTAHSRRGASSLGP